MLCERCNQRLSAYLDGELRGREREELEEHLATCRRCREDLREIGALREVLRSAADPEVRPEFWDESLRRVRAHARKAPRYRLFQPAYSAAATAVMVLLLTLVMQIERPSQRSRPTPAPVPELVISPVSLVSLHTRERSRTPLADVVKVRAAGAAAETLDIEDNGRFDIQ